jgi:2-(1,2-epoxy-1,2-dihydrophenyl)acetyl-CoA isomerase
MSYQNLLLEQRGHVGVVTLNRPERLNALSRGLRDDLMDAADQLRHDDGIWSIVITGAGRGFCSGADIQGGDPVAATESETAEPTAPSRADRMDDYEYHWVGQQAITLYEALDKPTVAAVNGPAAGAGMSLALACDLRVGSENTRFKTVFLERNLSPDSGMSYFLPRIVGLSRALDLVLSSRWCEPEEAYRIGLLDRVFPAGSLVDKAVELANELSSWPPLATQAAKRVLHHSWESTLRDQLIYEVHALTIGRHATNDAAESRAARTERRAPNWTGT